MGMERLLETSWKSYPAHVSHIISPLILITVHDYSVFSRFDRKFLSFYVEIAEV